MTQNILINGAPSDHVSAFDRGLQYGDGVFETIKVNQGRLCLWDNHIERLQQGCERLYISAPDGQVLEFEARHLAKGITKGVIKIIVTRGTGGRGYKTSPGVAATRILIGYSYPEYPTTYWSNGVATRFCQSMLGYNASLAGIKHLNRLEQIIARAEWQDEDISEGIMLDENGKVIEGTMTNIFFAEKNILVTPALEKCGVKGVMRDQILSIAQDTGVSFDISEVGKERLLAADEVFLSNSIIGIWPVNKIEQKSFTIGPITTSMMQQLQDLGI
ncbi:aminodeoxychorismate lyase [Kaarinaea lacus]